MKIIYKRIKGKAIGVIAITVVVVATVFLAVTIFKMSKSSGGKVTTISEASLEKVIELNDLSTLEYTYNAITEVYDESGKNLKYHVAYCGTVTAGIDITKIEIDVDQEAKRIFITLPNAEVQSVNVDMGTLEFIFSKKKYETETISQEAYKASLEDLENRTKEENGLLFMAKDNAVGAVEALIAPWVKQIDGEYMVEVK